MESIDFPGYFVMCVDIKPIKMMVLVGSACISRARNYFVFFLFDLFSHRNFLSEVVDFYSDFIILIENDLTEFRNTFRNNGKYVLGIKNIEKVMFVTKTYINSDEKCESEYRINKLSDFSSKCVQE